MKTFPQNIAIIGIGLIGGSIALGLKQHFGLKITILGSCKSLKRTQEAKQLGLIDEVLDLRAQPQGLKLARVGLIIIATPIKETVNILKLLSKIKLKSCPIIDVGSTKKFVIEAANQLFKPQFAFIGTHPMAGSEVSGFENADPNLFRNKPWIVCEGKTINNQQLTIAKRLIDILGAKMILMNAKKHDEITAWASHLNLISSSILVNTVGKQKNWPEAAKIASNGFRDTTRLASGDVEMKKDIITTNKQNIISTLFKFRQEIDLFINLLRNGSNDEMTNYLSQAKNIRDDWLVNYFS